MVLTAWAPDDEITSTRLNEMVDAFNDFEGVIVDGALVIADGTEALPGLRFSSDTNNGARRLDADEWALVAGGGITGGGTAIRMRAGLKYPQVGIGKMNVGTDNWYWPAVSANAAFAIQLNEEDAAAGSTVGMTSTVESQASSGPVSDPFPDSSAGSFFFIQRTGTPNGAGRAVEAHVIRDTATNSNTDANASIVAIEAAISTRWAGAGSPLYNKTVGINLLNSTAGLSAAGVAADTGLLIHGDGGWTRPIYYFNEQGGAGANDAWYIDTQGREFVGDAGNQAAPSRSYVGDTNTGEFRAAADTLAWATGGTERMRLNSDGLGVGRTPVAANALSVQGNSFLSSGAAGTNMLLQMGRTATEHTLAVVGGANQMIVGTAAGDLAFRAETGKKVLFGVDSVETARFDSLALTVALALSVTGRMTVAGGVTESGFVNAPQITSNQNNYAPTGITTTRTVTLDSDASRNITGIAAGQTVAGHMLRLINRGAQNIVLTHEDTGLSTATNCINTPTGASFTLLPARTVDLQWNGSRWRVLLYT